MAQAGRGGAQGRARSTSGWSARPMTACASSRSIRARAGAQPVAGPAPGAPWQIMQRIDHPDPAVANAQALQELENGADRPDAGVRRRARRQWLRARLRAESALARVLDGVDLDAGIAIELDLSPPTRTAPYIVAALVKRRESSPPASVDLRVGHDPIGGHARIGASAAAVERRWRTHFARRLSATCRARLSRARFAVADGRIIHNAGGSEAQELAFALAAAVDYLRALEADGVPLDAARGMIYFRLAADADEFLTIAKFRACGNCGRASRQACGLTPKPAFVAGRNRMAHDDAARSLREHAAHHHCGVRGRASAAPTRSRVLPFTAALGLPDAFARRVARNTQLVLLEESNLAKVADPAAGSGAIEDLTDKLCARGLGAVPGDRGGGRRLAAALETRPAFSARSPTMRAERAGRRRAAQGRAHRRQRLSRILHEAPSRCSMSPRVAAARAAPSKRSSRCRAIRLAEPFEALRDASDRDAGEDRRAAEGLPRQSRHSCRTSPRARRSPRTSSRPAASRRSAMTASRPAPR